jgi:hypothetical protein
MNSDIKKMWIEALLSEEYDQGQNWLCQENDDGSKSWCCLGVLTDLAIKNGVDVDVERASDDSCIFVFDNKMEYLPQKVMEWAGIETNIGEYSFPNYEFDDNSNCTLAEDNDSGLNFEELAEIIREYF